MKNKYYVPIIEEFHVGFEYYIEEINCGGSTMDWIKSVIKDGTQIDDITREHKGDDVYNLRVKFLDREDIESCGFKFKQEIREREIFDEYTFTNGILQHWFETNSIIIHSDGYNRVGSFIGTIRNKSEFSVLLRQLGIKFN